MKHIVLFNTLDEFNGTKLDAPWVCHINDLESSDEQESTLYSSIFTAGEVFKFIDLGLPSGTLWANMNIGATSSKDPGLFFQYGAVDNGQTVVKNGNIYSCTPLPYPRTQTPCEVHDYTYYMQDGKLKEEYDPAIVAKTNTCETPKVSDFTELVQYTDITIVNDEEFPYLVATSKSDPSKSIKLPAGGLVKNDNEGSTSVYAGGTAAYYLVSDYEVFNSLPGYCKDTYVINMTKPAPVLDKYYVAANVRPIMKK